MSILKDQARRSVSNHIGTMMSKLNQNPKNKISYNK